jgi:hypothetical protein
MDLFWVRLVRLCRNMDPIAKIARWAIVREILALLGILVAWFLLGTIAYGVLMAARYFLAFKA